MPKVVRVWIGKPNNDGHFNGTAFFINKNTLVTAKHVVLDRDNQEYRNIFLGNTPDGGIIPIDEVILCDRDLAILKIKKSFEIKNESLDKEIIEGKDVIIIGFYDDDSSINSYENRVSGYRSSEHTYELQSHLTNGLSGSPVLLDDKICGVANEINRKKNLTYIIPITELCLEEGLSKNQNKTDKKSYLHLLKNKIEEVIKNDNTPDIFKKFLKYIHFNLTYPWIGIPLNILMIGIALYNFPVINKEVNKYFDSNNSNKKIDVKEKKDIIVEKLNKTLTGEVQYRKGNQVYYLFREDDLDINTISDINGSFKFEDILGEHDEDDKIFITCCEDKDQEKCRKPSTECLIGENCDIR